MSAWLIAITVIAADLAIKGLIRRGGIADDFHLNRGLAFSLPVGTVAALLITGFILIILAAIFIREKERLTQKQITAYGLIFGGSLGNLLERVYSGYVTDFIKFGDSYLNIADLAIIAGILLLIATSYLYPRSNH